MQKWLKQKHAQRQKRRTQRREVSMVRKQVAIGILLVFAIGLILTGVYFGSRTASLQITQVEVHGGYTIAHMDVEAAVQEVLAGSYVRLVPHTFAWTYPARAINAALLEIPRLKQSSLELHEQKLVVVFDEYQPTALWCGAEKEDCYFIDANGFAFAKAPVLTGSAFIRFSDTRKEVAVKTDAVEQVFLGTAMDFSERLAAELGLYVTHIDEVNDHDVTYTVSGGGVIKVSRRMDLEETFNNLQTILLSEDFAHLETGAFSYIDLRFGDKIFVNEVGEVTQEETASSSKEAVE